MKSLESIVEDTIGYDNTRGDKITVRDFKFIGVKSLGDVNQTLDENGNPIIVESNQNVDTLSMIKSILKDFSEYIQYLIATILLFIFYKKFIVNHEIVIIGENGKVVGSDNDDLAADMLNDYENEFDMNSAQGRLKSKVKSQIVNNIDGLDEESAAKYEVFIEELDKEINNNPEEIARMIELLLSEGDKNFKG